jgi:uncharacterized Zn finger protein (UPF0148 family)
MSSESWGDLNPSLPRSLDPPESPRKTPGEIDEVRAAHQDVATAWLAGSAFTIPGMGERPESCGAWYPREVCDSCGEPIFRESHCGLRKCPKCWFEWVQDTAEEIVYRIQAYRWAQPDGVERRVVHAMFSPDQDHDGKWTIRETEDVRKDSYERATDAGVEGGAAILHPWRTTDATDELYAEEQPYDSKWKWLREKWDKSWRSAVEVAPHAHQLVIAPEFEPDEEDEWVDKRVRTLAPMKSLTGSESYEDLAKAATYILTHAGVRDGSQAIRWFGSMYPGGFDAEEELSDGARATIRRKSEEAVRGDDEEEFDEAVEADECEAGTEGCVGQPMAIWDVPSALRRDFFEDIDRETRNRMEACVEWMMGDLDPPPVYSEEEAREVLDELVEQL